MLLTAVITLLLDLFYKSLGFIDSRDIIQGFIEMFVRFFPALFFVCIGYFAFIVKEKTNCLNSRLKVFIADIASALLFILIESMTRNNVNMFRIDFGESAAVFLTTGILGSLAMILLCSLIPKNIKLLRAQGNESLHIMALHYPPIPIYRIMLWLSDKFIGSSLTIFASLATTAACYFTAVYIFEPICGILKLAFDSKFIRNT